MREISGCDPFLGAYRGVKAVLDVLTLNVKKAFLALSGECNIGSRITCQLNLSDSSCKSCALSIHVNGAYSLMDAAYAEYCTICTWYNLNDPHDCNVFHRRQECKSVLVPGTSGILSSCAQRLAVDKITLKLSLFLNYVNVYSAPAVCRLACA